MATFYSQYSLNYLRKVALWNDFPHSRSDCMICKFEWKEDGDGRLPIDDDYPKKRMKMKKFSTNRLIYRILCVCVRGTEANHHGFNWPKDRRIKITNTHSNHLMFVCLFIRYAKSCAYVLISTCAKLSQNPHCPLLHPLCLLPLVFFIKTIFIFIFEWLVVSMSPVCDPWIHMCVCVFGYLYG